MNAKRLTGDRNQCPGCGDYFNSVSAFDKHRTGTFGVSRRCRTVEEMFGAGMARNMSGFWVGKPQNEDVGNRISGGFPLRQGDRYMQTKTSSEIEKTAADKNLQGEIALTTRAYFRPLV